MDKYQKRAVGGNWFIFGESPDGTVDIANETDDVFQKLPLKVALNILAIRDKFMKELSDELESVNK